MASARNALKPGDILGRYQLLVPIGEGGMGRVWVAREQSSGTRQRLVAIKTALAEGTATNDFWKVLLDEARIASQVQHPNVCAIHELEKERGIVYVVMDWSDAGSLRELLDALPTHRLDLPIAARIIAEVCAGLHAAHEIVGEDGAALGVVHRDVSPQNILLSSTGHVKITDFGVAKARGQLHAPTQTGEVKGKLSYMAPEQVTTKDADRRADVFALGCVLFEATVGERPFHGDDALATLYQLLEQPLVPPSQRLAGYPPDFEDIVLRALQRRPEDRYATTEAMGRALEAWLVQERAIVNDVTVAAIVRGALGDKIEKRYHQIETANTQLDAGATTIEFTPDAGAQTLSGAAASTLQLDPPRPRKRVLGWALLGTTVAIASVGYALGKPGRPPAPLPDPRAALVTPVSAPVKEEPRPAASVVVNVRAEPPDAVLFLDEGPMLSNPYQTTVVADGRSHRLRASARGFADHVQEVTFDRDREIVVTLQKQGAYSIRKPVAVAVPQTTGTETTAPPTFERKPGELPPVIHKPPRTLDADNPFAKKP